MWNRFPYTNTHSLFTCGYGICGCVSSSSLTLTVALTLALCLLSAFLTLSVPDFDLKLSICFILYSRLSLSLSLFLSLAPNLCGSRRILPSAVQVLPVSVAGYVLPMCLITRVLQTWTDAKV